jgi:poly-gamma-glutamate synthase PgsB/CapB
LGERFLLDKRLKKIPLRICVTGTRGKSSVTRLLASSLREAGFRVLAKTTGSKPIIIYPGGEEAEIQRKGPASILEQRKIVGLAAQLGVQALVVELMSIQPECLRVESRWLLKPHILLITNVRLDHLEHMGNTKREIAESLTNSFPKRGTIFVPEEELFPEFEKSAEKQDSKILQVAKDHSKNCSDWGMKLPFNEFEDNIRIALAVSEFLDVRKEVAFKGMSKAHPDFGSLKIWSASFGYPARSWLLVSAFAANEPESTGKILSKLKERIPLDEKGVIGLLNFREDRGDRTLQWLNALKEGSFSEFQRVVFIGGHAHALNRKIKKKPSWGAGIPLAVITDKQPAKIMLKLSSVVNEDAVIVGMGNMGGLGKELIEYWEKIGSSYGV